jgi:UDP-3-O-[3-hydroxymyristoyl] glucosamine N-acyltransferase
VLGTLRQLSERVGGRVAGDGEVEIERISAVDDAGPGALTFATDQRYFAKALVGGASAILVDESLAPEACDKPLLIVEHVRHALAGLLAALRPSRPRGPHRDPLASIAIDAEIAEDAYVAAHAYVGAGARIGRGTALEPGAYVGQGAQIGEDVWLHPGARVMAGCTIGNRVVLHAGSVIGSEGFGWAFLDGRLERIPQIGNVVVDDDVEIGANTCVDRAQTGSTHIGAGTKIDNLVQIGHNCRIGKHCVLAALTGLAGSTVVGDGVQIAGQVGTKGHMKIGSGATVAGQSGVWGDVAEGTTVSGNPARSHREDLRREVMIRNLPKLVARVDVLERALERDGE